jgi:hypothetical protein
MKLALNSLKIAGVLAMTLSCALPAGATEVLVGLDQEWNWQGNGTSLELNVTNNNFSFVIGNGIVSPIPVFDYTLPITTFNTTGGFVTISGNTATVKSLLGVETGSVDLSATSGKFKFAFSNGSTDYTYDIYSLSDKSYKLVGDNGEIVLVTASCGTLTPSPVPVPGSALLLGSSLLGLVGISSRRKKA